MVMFDVRFCRCGRIHVMDGSVYDWLAGDHTKRSVVRICSNCGVATRSFLDTYEDGFAMNTYDLRDTEEEMFAKVIASSGIRVYMKSGEEADTFQNGYFANCDEWRRMENTRRDFVSICDAEKQGQDWATVDTERLIQDVKRKFKDQAADVLKYISGYMVKIHWAGTEFEKDWNK